MTAPTPQEVTDVGLRLKHSAGSPALAIGLRDLLADAADTLAAVTAERDQAIEALAATNKLGAFETGKTIGAAEVRKELDQARQLLADAEKKIASMELDESLREEDERFADPL